MITVLTGVTRSDGAALLQFTGPALRAVTWSLQAGSGVITPKLPYTDASGVAYATYDPDGYEGAATIRVTYGA